ncbi:alpha/beta fold hydrolase [Saccharothrix sp. S26]|uniref:alpha/beta fold hydrolase n=1 Tax=Saccharothrix sp. S26 TaxID=2907215 RepID=UPI001F1705A7|nr:alpha/beta fold hydrolase [Saccharothrix sp. S26]MCE6994698.1 alpha/beta fold hydrolase [Saccharothrix sp. S26]
MTERIMRANGVDLCVETFGTPADPAVLLIAGATGSMLSWDDAFCARLADGGRYVIRYDHRDTGRSVTYPPGEPGYGFADLVADAVGVLDALAVVRAGVVGISMGGGIAQLLALDHADRVASLTLIATSPAGPNAPGLPPMSPELLAHFAAGAPPAPDWTDRDAVVEHLAAEGRPYAGPRPVDARAAREAAGRVFDRARNIASSANHFLAGGGEPWRSRLGEIAVPTLVLHGDADPLTPPAHGEAMAREVPGARLVLLEDTGHELPPGVWDVVVPEIVAHTALARPSRDEVLARIRRLGTVDAGTAFERLYAAAARGEVDVPWHREQPHRLIVARFDGVDGTGKRALVVGAGYGQDAGYLAGLGFDVVGFDISPTAVAAARERFPAARFEVADLLDPPAAWAGAFDVVLDVLIAQSLPADVRPTAIANTGRFVAPGGTLLVLAHARADDEPATGPPWPLTRAEVESYATDDLRAVRVDRAGPGWRAEFRRAVS